MNFFEQRKKIVEARFEELASRQTGNSEKPCRRGKEHKK